MIELALEALGSSFANVYPRRICSFILEVIPKLLCREGATPSRSLPQGDTRGIGSLSDFCVQYASNRRSSA